MNIAVSNTVFREVLVRLRRDFDIHAIPLTLKVRENSKILRVQALTGEAPPYLLIKVYANNDSLDGTVPADRLKRDYAVMHELYSRWKDSPKFGVPKPIACYPDILAIVMEECHGENLSVILNQEARFFPRQSSLSRLEQLCYQCGEWLRLHHNEETKVPGSYTLKDFLDYVDARLQKLVSQPTVPIDDTLRCQVLHRIEEQWHNVDVTETCTVDIHGDYCPSNVMVVGKRLIVIDLAQYGRGAIYHDLSRFYHQLDMYLVKPTFRRKVIRHLQRALLDGYDPTLSPQNPLFQLLYARHTFCHLLGISRWENLPIHERLYNRMLIKRHMEWLKRWLKAKVRQYHFILGS